MTWNCYAVPSPLKNSLSLTTWRLNSCPGTIFQADSFWRSFKTVTKITWKGNMFTFPERSSVRNTMLEAFNSATNSATYITIQCNGIQYNKGLFRMQINRWRNKTKQYVPNHWFVKTNLLFRKFRGRAIKNPKISNSVWGKIKSIETANTHSSLNAGSFFLTTLYYGLYCLSIRLKT